jgi:hypothetical protein
MLNARNLMYWVRNKNTPFTEGVLVKEDGTLVSFTFDHSLYGVLRTHGDAVGAVSYNARHGAWSVEATCPHTKTGLYYTAESAEEGASWLLAALADNAEDAAALAADPALRAAHLIKRMDWYSHMSDDHGVWSAGERAMKELLSALKEMDEESARLLWSAHAPEGFASPV